MVVLKKCCIALLLLWCAAFSLHAQQAGSKTYVFFASVTGPGHTLEDNSILNRMIINEFNARKYTLLNTPQGANFLLYGTLDLFDDENDYNTQVRPTIAYTYNAALHDYSYDQLYLFQLILRKVDTGDIILQNIIYTSIEDIYNFFPIIVNNLILHIGGTHFVESWPNKWIYAGVTAFWSPRIYSAVDNRAEASTHYANFGGGIVSEAHLLDYLSVELGGEIVPDWVAHAKRNARHLMIEVPFSVKYIARLTNYFFLGPYIGILFNAPLYDETQPPLIAGTLGLTGGIRIGEGMVFIDHRFSMDIGRSRMKTDTSKDEYDYQYQRSIIHIGIGYKHGFLPRRQR